MHTNGVRTLRDRGDQAVRAAREADLPRLLAITNQAIVETTTVFHLRPTTLAARQSWWREKQADGWPVLVAEVAGAVQGYGSFGTFRPFEGFAQTVEHAVYVDPAAQGRGLGTALLAALVAEARGMGKHAMIGVIEAGNAGSLALHRRAGFSEVGRMPEVGRKFERWLDVVFMQKLL